MSFTLNPRTTALVLIDLQNGVMSMPLAAMGPAGSSRTRPH